MRNEASRLPVLVVPPSYFARDRIVGGGERYAFEYARALADLTPTTLALFDAQARTESAGTLSIKTFSVRGFSQRGWFPLTRATWRGLAEYKVVHIMVFPTPLTDLLLLLGRWRGQTVVLTDVGGGGACWSTYLQKLHPRLNLNRLAHGLALLSQHATTLFDNWSQPKTVLYGGADLERFVVGSTPSGGYALFVGRLLAHKGVLELIEALGSNTPLHVVGRPYDPDYLAKLQHAAQAKQVQFVLDADDAELQRQYRGASVVLQPSLPGIGGGVDTSELLGLVALEAMACGKPVIVTRTASLPELVIDGETGIVVPPNNPVALREAVERLVADPQLSLRLGGRARRHVEQNFTWAGVARRGLAFYEELARQLTRR